MEHLRTYFVIEPGTAHELCTYSLEVGGRQVLASSSSGAVQRYSDQQRQKQYGARNLWVWPEGLTGVSPELFMVYVFSDGHFEFVLPSGAQNGREALSQPRVAPPQRPPAR